MTFPAWADGVWLIASLGLLTFLQRQVHKFLQSVLLLGTWSYRIAFALYALLLLPGVVFHELSHWVVATLLGVRVHRMSLWPKEERGGRVRFGYVATDQADPVRAALIGLAPTLAGCAVLLIGFSLAGMASVLVEALETGDADLVFRQGAVLIREPGAAGWIYLALAVGNTMLPSPSDRAAWLAAGALIAIVVGAIALAGAGGWLVEWGLPSVRSGVRALAAAFSLVAALDVAFLAILWLLRAVLEALTGRRVVERA